MDIIVYLCIEVKRKENIMKRVYVDWETDGTPIEDIGLPIEVDVPNNIETNNIADWLSDKYGFLVNGFVYIK